MKNILLTVAIVTTSLLTNAQDTSSGDKAIPVKHKLGLHAGTTTGVGLSYKVEFKNKHQVQFVALPIASKEEKIFFSGLSYRYKFKTMENWDALTYVGASYYYYKYTWDYDVIIEPVTSDVDQQLNCSGGVAFEYGKNEFFKINLQLGYGLYNILNEEWRTSLSAGIGVDFLLNKL